MDEMMKQPDLQTAPEQPPDRPPGEAGDQYKIRLEIFEGPLDLLLYLIKKEEVSIYDIPIARITEQYLDYLSAMEELDIAIAGEFLLMAATLIHIKSQMLLPRDPEHPEQSVEDPRDELVHQLIEHQKFKAAANSLYQRATIEAAMFTRAALETDSNNPEISATAFQLFELFREVLNRKKGSNPTTPFESWAAWTRFGFPGLSMRQVRTVVSLLDPGDQLQRVMPRVGC